MTAAQICRMVDELNLFRRKITEAERRLMEVRRMIVVGKTVDHSVIKTIAADLAFYSRQIERLSDELGLFAFDFSGGTVEDRIAARKEKHAS